MQIVNEWDRATPNGYEPEHRVFLRHQYYVIILYFDFIPMLLKISIYIPSQEFCR